MSDTTQEQSPSGNQAPKPKGRPPGSKNKVKTEGAKAAAKVKRGTASKSVSYADPVRGYEHYLNKANAIARDELPKVGINREQIDIWGNASKADPALMDEKEFCEAFRGGVAATGQMLQSQVMPHKDAVSACAHSWYKVYQLLPPAALGPWGIVAGAVASTAVMAMPMIQSSEVIAERKKAKLEAQQQAEVDAMEQNAAKDEGKK
jgi:hypothetical protein